MKGNLRRNDPEIHQDVYVVSGLHKPLVGRSAIDGLGIATLVEPVLAENDIAMFLKIFLGKLKDYYIIKPRQEEKLFALTTSTRIVMPLASKFNAEFHRMEHLGVISKVNVMTEWCSGIVVVSKPNGKIKICVDLTRLNQNIC